MIRPLRLLVLGAASGAVAGCGGGGAEDVLGQTADRLGEIRSGTLELALIVTPREGGEFGFDLRGPFDLGERGRPRMRIDYTRIVDGRRAKVTLVSTGQEAWAEANGQRIELSAEQQKELLGSLDGGAVSGLEELSLDDWIEDPEVSDGGEVGGANTDKVSGELDVVATANGLIELVRGLGSDLRPIRGRQAEQLRRATRSSRFELWTGEEDHLLRRLVMEADLGLDVPKDLREALGDVVGAKVTFRVGVTRPNEPVEIR